MALGSYLISSLFFKLSVNLGLFLFPCPFLSRNLGILFFWEFICKEAALEEINFGFLIEIFVPVCAMKCVYSGSNAFVTSYQTEPLFRISPVRSGAVWSGLARFGGSLRLHYFYCTWFQEPFFKNMAWAIDFSAILLFLSLSQLNLAVAKRKATLPLSDDADS